MSTNKALGSRIWLIPDCYYPSTSSPGHYVSHEAICVLNVGDKDAHLKLTLYFEDRDPIRSFKAVCKAERTNHIRLTKLGREWQFNSPDVPYAVMVESDQPVVVQYSRLIPQAEMSLMTTMAHPMG